MADFYPAIQYIEQLEGGYKLTDHKNDRGGLTYCGITRKNHPDWGGWVLIDNEAHLDPVKLPQLIELVREFYKKHYWDKIQGDHIDDQQVATYVFQSAVLRGVKSAVKSVQKVLGLMPRDIDGIFGPYTLEEINDRIDYNAKVLLVLLAFEDIERYLVLVNRTEDQRVHLRGWLNRVLTSAGKNVW